MRINEQSADRKPPGRAPATPQTPGVVPAGLLALQSTAGNAAVVQMLRQAGHTRAPAEQHQHGAGCGHQQQPAVQRSAVHDVLRAGGRPLDTTTRTDMETRLGADFSDVRIHNDSAAKASAAEVGARAYTSGSHIVIGEGGADKHTLAHELTHVVQQREGPVAGVDNGAGLRVSDPSDRFEREAEATARRVMSGPAVTRLDVQGATERQAPVGAQVVQRAPDVQDFLKDDHWAKRAAGLPKQNPRPTSKPRLLKEVLAETGPALLDKLRKKYTNTTAKQRAAMGQLEIFRTMEIDECEAIMHWWNSDHQRNTADWMKKNRDDPEGIAARFKEEASMEEPMIGVIPVKNHLGDEGQARTYIDDRRPGEQALMKFTLKPGVHEILFDSEHMAVSGESNNRTPQSLRNIAGAKGGSMPEASTGEGVLGGHIGLKQEKKGDFSLSVGDSDASRLLFQQFLTKVEIVPA
ncbi:eCIS core domain-containing protein [Streptomyces sp. P9-A2]|uniref:eCIS core domain-containing protein n=1 Tax=Streptomyces sp. P9-A2 TaxID=3072284 RepID=UPI002FCC0F81